MSNRNQQSVRPKQGNFSRNNAAANYSNNFSSLPKEYFPDSNNFPSLSDDFPPLSNRNTSNPSNINSDDFPPLSSNSASNEMKPSSNGFRPPSNEFPPLSNEIPPLSNEFPPLSNDFPPLSNDFPPLSNEFPPLSNEFPPLSNDFPPLSNDFPPLAAAAGRNLPPQSTATTTSSTVSASQPNQFSPPAATNRPPQSLSPPSESSSSPPRSNKSSGLTSDTFSSSSSQNEVQFTSSGSNTGSSNNSSSNNSSRKSSSSSSCSRLDIKTKNTIRLNIGKLPGFNNSDSRESCDSPETEMSITPPPDHNYPMPKRPNFGTEGKSIALRANHLQVSVKPGYFYHYKVIVLPGGCPKKINRQIIQAMVRAYAKFFSSAAGEIRPAYDGRDNLYTRELIPSVMENRGRQFLDVCVSVLNGKERFFNVEIRFEGTVSQYELLACLDGSKDRIPHASLFALDVVLRHRPSLMYTPVGRSFYSPPDPNNHYPLGGGREVWFGFHQSLRPSYWNISLNVDISATAFYKPMPMLEYIVEFLDLRTQRGEPLLLTDAQRLRLTRELKGLRVEVTHCHVSRKYRICNITRKSSLAQTFPLVMDNSGRSVECTVFNFFRDKYGIRLREPHLPCLQVGQEAKQTYLPMEICRVMPGQRCLKKLTDLQTSTMIKSTSKTAQDREREIRELVQRADYNNDPFVQDFGVHVSNSLMETPGRVLNPPRLEYSGADKPVYTLPSQGIWDMRGKKFYDGIVIKDWALACFSPVQVTKPQDLRNLVDRLRKIGGDLGMKIECDPSFCKYVSESGNIPALFEHIRREYRGIQLMLVILPGKTPVYGEIKRLGDSVYGLTTQCIKAKNVGKITAQLISNLCLKINAKMGGINTILEPESRPNLFKEPVIFLGAVVTHPPVCDSRKPSVAALVGSMDAHPSTYSATVRIQKVRRDLIVSMCSMVKEQLITFFQRTGFKPHRIVMYRDAVSESQIDSVFQYELLSIRQACMELEDDYKPGITYVIVQKRHHTRLFCVNPKDRSGRTGNIPAGTTVDTNITHPIHHDFFLCSHQGIQGTSRPSYYRCMWDDNKMSADDLQSLTYALCHTYVRCTRSVSVPAPAYYAHLVAVRARYHIVDKENEIEMSMPEVKDSFRYEIIERSIQVHENTKDQMYFA